MAVLHYQEFRPDPSLADWIDCPWLLSAELESEQLEEHWVLPNGCASLLYWLPVGFSSPFRAARKLLLMGPSRRAFRKPLLPGECFLGIRMKPGTATGISGKPITALADRTVLLDAVVESSLVQWESLLAETSSEAESFPLLQRLLRSLLLDKPPLDEAMVEAASAIRVERGRISLDRMAASHFLCERQFLRRFRNAVGLGPKEFARIARLHAIVRESFFANTVSWASASAQAGYYDQSHLLHEFAQLGGGKPSDFHAYLQEMQVEDLIPWGELAR